ncbi:hypothetical protein EDB89DRAFT_1902894 [Lactarius sanguifluus]|nr:hypothetical protein EDB89DRAFT_1902894 [Lactarius sanguifluus]
MCACWTRPRPYARESVGPQCGFGYQLLVVGQRDLGIRFLGAFGAAHACRLDRPHDLPFALIRERSYDMLLEAIEAMELPKSTLLYILAYAAPKFVPKKGMSSRACPMTPQMSTHYYLRLASRGGSSVRKHQASPHEAETTPHSHERHESAPLFLRIRPRPGPCTGTGQRILGDDPMRSRFCHLTFCETGPAYVPRYTTLSWRARGVGESFRELRVIPGVITRMRTVYRVALDAWPTENNIARTSFSIPAITITLVNRGPPHPQAGSGSFNVNFGIVRWGVARSLSLPY